MNTNNVIDFTSRKTLSTPGDKSLPKEEISEEDRLRELTYNDVDEAFECFLIHMSENLEYKEVMHDNLDLEIAMGYILTIARSAYLISCGMEDNMSELVRDIVASLKENRDEAPWEDK